MNGGVTQHCFSNVADNFLRALLCRFACPPCFYRLQKKKTKLFLLQKVAHVPTT